MASKYYCQVFGRKLNTIAHESYSPPILTEEEAKRLCDKLTEKHPTHEFWVAQPTDKG